MPVEIRKLVIQAKVTVPQKATNAQIKSDAPSADLDKIIDACVKAVLKTLEKQKKR